MGRQRRTYRSNLVQTKTVKISAVKIQISNRNSISWSGDADRESCVTSESNYHSLSRIEAGSWLWVVIHPIYGSKIPRKLFFARQRVWRLVDGKYLRAWNRNPSYISDDGVLSSPSNYCSFCWDYKYLTFWPTVAMDSLGINKIFGSLVENWAEVRSCGWKLKRQNEEH